MPNRLLMFYGTECTHCHEMDDIVSQVEQELKVTIIKLESWHNAQNRQLLEKVDTIACGGVPFFFNEKTKKAICGSTTLEKLKKWASE